MLRLKHLTWSFALALPLQLSATTTGTACGTNKELIEYLAASSGAARLSILGYSAGILERPDAVQSVGQPSMSQSVGMFETAEAFTAANLVSNELEATKNNAKLAKTCDLILGTPAAKLAIDQQLDSYICTIRDLLNRVVVMFTELDTYYQRDTELKATKNQAVAESKKREANIKEEQQKMKALNKELKTAIDQLDKAKKAQEKAAAAVEKAQEALSKAQATPCAPPAEEDGPEDCSARDAAVASATKELDGAKAELRKAEKELKKAVKVLVVLLVDKMGVETNSVLALLTGTIRGDSDGASASFRVNGSDYTLVNIPDVAEKFLGIKADDAVSFLNSNDAMSDNAANFFIRLAHGFNTNKDLSDVEIDKTRTPYAADPRADYGDYAFFKPKPETYRDSSSEVLTELSAMSGGIENLTTIALAVADFTNNSSDKMLDRLEKMKTPESRVEAFNDQIAQNAELINKTKLMIDSALCNLATMHHLFVDVYEQNKNSIPLEARPLLEYVKAFSTAPLKQRLSDGYPSRISPSAILKEMECVVDRNNVQSCKAATTTAQNQCRWSAAVIGPYVGLSHTSCPYEGLTKEHDGYTWKCRCE